MELYTIELHIVTACLVLLALRPAKEMYQHFLNWRKRVEAHKEHIKRLEEKG